LDARLKKSWASVGFKNLVHFHEDGFAITARGADLKVFYFFDKFYNVKTKATDWKLSGNIEYKNKSINLKCQTYRAFETEQDILEPGPVIQIN
jgi:hypothetical protein